MRKYLLNFLVWLALSLLVGIAFLYTENQGAGFLYLILAVAALKFITISLQFMELKHAHIIWPVWIVLLLAFYAVGVLSFATP